MRARTVGFVSLTTAIALACALVVPSSLASADVSSVAPGAPGRAALKAPAVVASAVKKQSSPVPAKAKASGVGPSSLRSVIDSSVTYSAAQAPAVIDPLAPSVPGELVVVLHSGIVAPSTERALEARGGTVEHVRGNGALLLVTAPGGVSDPVFTQFAKDSAGVAWVQPNYIYRKTSADPLFSLQWGLTKIGAPQAWTVTRGKETVVVAVVDTGVDYTHPDLVGRVDTANDYDFVNGDSDAMDDNGHGTHVSGIIAATADNNIGGAGVAPECKILPVKVLDSKGSGDTIGVAAGIRYAADAGAKIINLSLAGPSDATMGDAVAYAQGKGCIVVAAAGNDGSSAGASYPARYANVVGVGATDSSNAHATFSNYGPGVDIAAPGVNVLSTVLGGGYASWSGTSMASPFVSAVAALVWSLDPSTPASETIARVLGTAAPLNTLGVGGLVRADLAVAPPGSSADDQIPGVALTASPVTGALARDTDPNDVYSVYLGQGQTLDAALTMPSGADFDLLLYGPDAADLEATGSVVTSDLLDSNPARISYTAPATGWYYLDASARIGAGPYALTWTRTGVSDDNLPGIALPASPVHGTLDQSGDLADIYQIDLQAGQQLSVYMAGPTSADFDLWLFGPGSTSIDVDAPIVKRESAYSDELLRYAATAPGTYSVMVYAYRGSGAYSLDWSVDPFSPDDDIPGVPLPKSTVTSEVGGLSDTDDVYKVYLQAGQTIDCTLTVLGEVDPPPMLYLFDPTQTTDVFDTSVAEATTYYNPKSLEYVAESTGYYYVDVYSGGDPTFYQLDWSATQARDDNIPGVDGPSARIFGELGVTTDTDDVYRLHAHAGEWISASLTGSPTESTDFDLYLYGREATDTRRAMPVAKADGSLYPKTVGYRAPATGDCYLQAHAFAGEGTYQLTWSAKPFATVSTPIAPYGVSRGHAFTVYGYVAPHHTSGTYLVTLKFYLKDSHGAWVYHHSVRARRYAYSRTRTRYRAITSLPHAGQWRVRAMHEDATHAASYSGYHYITVR